MAKTASLPADEPAVESRAATRTGAVTATRAPSAHASFVQDVVQLQEPRLTESSGLAWSNRRSTCFWSHNDSGGAAELYAFERNGRKCGQLSLVAAGATDWEDMASYRQQGVPRLIVADCGDNDARRSEVVLYLFDEPDPAAVSTLPREQMQTLRVTYPDGPRDCEAVAVDPDRGVIVMIAKHRLPLAGIYTLPLPQREAATAEQQVVAKRVGTLPMPMVTAMDLDPVTGDIWVVSYFHAFHFECSARTDTIAEQMKRIPKSRELPRWRQIEAIAIDSAHRVWLTSEGRPAPMGCLSVGTHADGVSPPDRSTPKLAP